MKTGACPGASAAARALARSRSAVAGRWLLCPARLLGLTGAGVSPVPRAAAAVPFSAETPAPRAPDDALPCWGR